MVCPVEEGIKSRRRLVESRTGRRRAVSVTDRVVRGLCLGEADANDTVADPSGVRRLFGTGGQRTKVTGDDKERVTIDLRRNKRWNRKKKAVNVGA